METSQALKIVKLLVDGINPHTGELYPHDSPYQNIEIVRALFVAAQSLTKQAETERRRQFLPDKVGKPWSAEEETSLISHFDSGKSEGQIAQELKRTVGAIRARLVKLGKIQDEGWGYRGSNRAQ